MVGLRILLLSFCYNGLVFLKNSYRTIISWITYNFEQWFWRNSKKEKTIYVYSDDNCRIDKTGGPYEVRIRKSDDKGND